MKPDTPTTDRLKHLSELYFEGLTSLEEEAELRRLVADPELTGPEADEVRAVMSFGAWKPTPRASLPARKRPAILRLPTIAAAAASVAIVATVGYRHFSGTAEQSDCYAYVDGHLIENPEKVMSIVTADLQALGDASETIEEEIDENLSLFSSAMRTQPSQETESL